MVSTIAPWAELVPDVDRLVTAEELLHWPEDPEFPWRYELVAGRLVRMAPTGGEHGDVSGNFYFALRSFTQARRFGLVTMPDTGFRLERPGEGHIVLAPDAAFIGPERMAQLPPPGAPERKGYYRVPPDLAFEVPSPDQYRPEMAAKVRLYLTLGVRMVWIAWPGRREVEVWRAGANEPVTTLQVGDILDGADVIPGFGYSVSDLFA